jgi:hypothetical protein
VLLFLKTANLQSCKPAKLQTCKVANLQSCKPAKLQKSSCLQAFGLFVRAKNGESRKSFFTHCRQDRDWIWSSQPKVLCNKSLCSEVISRALLGINAKISPPKMLFQKQNPMFCKKESQSFTICKLTPLNVLSRLPFFENNLNSCADTEAVRI